MTLTLLVLMPLMVAVMAAFVPVPGFARSISLAGSFVTGALSLLVLARFESVADYQMVESFDWIPSLGVSWTLGIDGISLFLVVLTGVIFPIAIYCCPADHTPGAYYGLIMLLMSGAMGAFLAIDLLLFFLFFEVVLVPMYLLIGRWGHGKRVYAAMKFFLYTMAASALMLVGIIATAALARPSGAELSFDIRDIAAGAAFSETAAMLILLSFMIAFAVKVPLFPVHTWLPDAHTEAPTAGSVILAGVMLKLGTYGMIRFGMYLFPQATYDLAPVFLTLAVIGIIYGAAVATMQTDLKRLVAYSSVAHMGFVVLGIFAFNSQGVQGSVLQMVNHGISTGALFIVVGWIYDRRHTRKISELSGLQKSAPVMAAVMTLVVLSSIGLPGLNGFVGEFLILLGAFSAARWWAVVAVVGVIFAALYLLWAYQRTFHGKATGANADMEDLSKSEIAGILPLLGLIVFMGVYPNFVLDRISPSVDALVDSFTEANAEFGYVEAEPAAPAVRSGVAGLSSEASHDDDHSDDDHGSSKAGE